MKFLSFPKGSGRTDSYLDELVNTAKDLQAELRWANNGLFWTITAISVFFNVLAYMPIFLGNKPLEALKAVVDHGDVWTGFIVFLNALAAVVWAYAITALQVSSLANWKISRWAKILCLASFAIGTLNNLQGMETAVPAPPVSQLPAFYDYMLQRLPFAFGLELLPLVFKMLGRKPLTRDLRDSKLEENLTHEVVDDGSRDKGKGASGKHKGGTADSFRKSDKSLTRATNCSAPNCQNTVPVGEPVWILEVGVVGVYAYTTCRAHVRGLSLLARSEPMEVVRNWTQIPDNS